MEDRTFILSRMFIILGLILLIPCILAFQLVRINYVEGEKLRELWTKQAIELIPIPAQRGNIYDANGTLLATNAVDYKIAFDPKAPGVTLDVIEKLAIQLGNVTGIGSRAIHKKLNSAPSHSRYVVLADNLGLIQKDEIESLDLDGVIIEENYRRRYTFNTLAAHVLGFVNYNMEGRTGLESFYNAVLKGEDGLRQVRRDPFNRIYEYVGAPKRLPQNGYSLHTTIDAYLQAILEDELKAGFIRTDARYATGIIMDPRTGAIKALANYPTFNPNFPGSSTEENRRNFAISDMIEPGSTFKIVTAVAAVEQEVVKFNEIFETPDNGVKVIHDLVLRDHDPLGDLTFQEVIQKSSNIATAEIAMRLDPEVFYQYARNMGFGTPTNIDLTGEVSGSLAKPYDWSLVTLPWMSHGYEVQVTPLQLTQAYAAFANNGKMMRPYVVDRIEDSHGNIIKKFDPTLIREIAEKSTIEKLLPVFESVVSDSGTGAMVQVEGLSIAGKTGTAKKVVNGQYIDRYRGSFVGFFPVKDPKYVILILMDEPKNSIYGGRTAGPVFKNVAIRIAGFDGEIQKSISTNEKNMDLAIVPDLEGLHKLQAQELLETLVLPYSFKGTSGIVTEQNIPAGTTIKIDDQIVLTLSNDLLISEQQNVKEGYAIVPELIGLSMRQATTLLNSVGLKIKIIGSGTITSQFPYTGNWLQEGNAVAVRGTSKSMEILTQSASD